MKKTSSVFKLKFEIYLVLFISMLSIAVINYYNLDFYLADLIYNPTGSWFYQDYWLTNLVIHKFGKYALILLYLIFVYKFLSRDKAVENRKEDYAKKVLLVSILIGTIVVSILKHTLNVDCPWSLIQYGGDKPFFSLFNYDEVYLPSSHCFPSGHASSAFTWISVYFYSTIYYPKQRFKILTIILILGFGFGFSQQFRGAHFISHDIWSLIVCIFVNSVIYKIAFKRNSTR